MQVRVLVTDPRNLAVIFLGRFDGTVNALYSCSVKIIFDYSTTKAIRSLKSVLTDGLRVL